MKKLLKLDYSLLIMLFIFFIISLQTINSAQHIINDDTLVFKQTIWYLIGFGLIFLILKLKNEFIFKNIWILYIIGNLSLLGLLLFATPINNAKAWYHIPGGTIQPSEFVKIILIIAIATIVKNFYNQVSNPSFKDELILILKVTSIIIIPSLLTFLQPDTGVVLIYLIITIVMLFISGIKYRWFIILFSIIILTLIFIISIYFINTDLFIDIFGTDFFLRIDRLLDWSNQSGYQLENGITAIGSAGMTGHGLNNTPVYFPEAQTDFIFAVFASNFGFIGSTLLFALFIIFDLKLIKIALNTHSLMNKIIIAGFIGMIIYQQFQNIGMTFGIIPITGITLPFISYGGSSLLSYMIMMGIIFNIDKEKKLKNKHIL